MLDINGLVAAQSVIISTNGKCTHGSQTGDCVEIYKRHYCVEVRMPDMMIIHKHNQYNKIGASSYRVTGDNLMRRSYTGTNWSFVECPSTADYTACTLQEDYMFSPEEMEEIRNGDV